MVLDIDVGLMIVLLVLLVKLEKCRGYLSIDHGVAPEARRPLQARDRMGLRLLHVARLLVGICACSSFHDGLETAIADAAVAVVIFEDGVVGVVDAAILVGIMLIKIRDAPVNRERRGSTHDMGALGFALNAGDSGKPDLEGWRQNSVDRSSVVTNGGNGRVDFLLV